MHRSQLSKFIHSGTLLGSMSLHPTRLDHVNSPPMLLHLHGFSLAEMREMYRSEITATVILFKYSRHLPLPGSQKWCFNYFLYSRTLIIKLCSQRPSFRVRTFSKDTIFWDRPAQRTSRLSHPTLAYAWGKPCSGTKHWRANCTEKDMVPWFPSNRFAHSKEQHWTQMQEMMNYKEVCTSDVLDFLLNSSPCHHHWCNSNIGSCCSLRWTKTMSNNRANGNQKENSTHKALLKLQPCR